MTKIIGLFPLTGNGGIASWTKKFLTGFPDSEFSFYPVDVSPKKHNVNSIIERFYTGFHALFRIRREIKSILNREPISILHTTTSGNIGSLRDIMVARLCKRYHVKTIMHCRYGCIPEDYKKRGLIGWLLRKAINLFDQIWVLDKRTFTFLHNYEDLQPKVFLTPNSIEVFEPIDNHQKEFKRIAFVGNLIPTKGLYELTKAAIKCDVRLDIIGPGPEDVISHLKELVGNHLNNKVFIHGGLPNKEAVKFMHVVDIIALPTYYASEAFPISILEAMSLTKMIISCPRAAIPDMLTGLDGKHCGILVPEKSVEGIVSAIQWCQEHKTEANLMCQKAYEKVYACYRTEIVYELYREYYRKACE